MADEVKAPVAPEVKSKRPKKLAKTLSGNVLTIKESVTGMTLTFDAGKLPENIKANLMPYGLSQKLGDAAAGKSGKDAVDAINKVWEGLTKGDWSVRAPAEEKVSKKGILEKYDAMPAGKDKENFAKILLSIGIDVAKR